MLFNSISFLIFFPSVVFLYYLFPHKLRWLILLISSYYFYMVWNPIYVLLIIFSTLINYSLSILIYKSKVKKYKIIYLAFSIIVSLGLLFLFKYFNLFLNTFNQLTNNNYDAIYILLPMGISFYTFQTLSYTIDVFKGKREAEFHIGYFSLYVVYFPQLVAGPIERSDKLIPELKKNVILNSSQVLEGIKKMSWGFFKKIVIADNLAIAVNFIYSDVETHSGMTLLLATFFFAIQIFADFSGYSDIAVGASKVMGINLMENFKRPYFSTTLKDFWSRWHISLSNWFRDYVYIPLGGSKKSSIRTYINILIVFMLSGLWHGASWMFVIWGAAHGVYLITERSISKITRKIWKTFKLENSKFKIIFNWILTTTFIMFTWIFFRSESLQDAFFISSKIFNDIIDLSLFNNLALSVRATQIGFASLITTLLSIILMEFNHFLEEIHNSDYFILLENKLKNRLIPIYLLIMWILITGSLFSSSSEFIYFQF